MGRSRQGEFNCKAKLNVEAVLKIWAHRKDRTRGLAKQLAQEFGVNESTVRGILSGHKWTHITQSMTENEDGNCEEE